MGKLIYRSRPSEAISYLSAAINNAMKVDNKPKIIELAGYLSKSCSLTGNYYGVIESVDTALKLIEAPDKKLECALIKQKKLNAMFCLGNAEEIYNMASNDIIPFVEKALGALPDMISFRYNPGSLKNSGVNSIIGKPEEAKYGLTREQIFEAYKICRDKGVSNFALHTMVASNELNPDCFVETAGIIFTLAAELKEKTGVKIELIDLGGGLGIPYKPGQKAVDYTGIAKRIRDSYDRILVPAGLDPVKICWECGRPVTGPYGWLVTRAIHEKHIYREYIGVDASMADLMRPGMYGAYHHVTVNGKPDPVDFSDGTVKSGLQEGRDYRIYDVVGSLCENCDKFAVQRPLPPIDTGDLIIIHDAGAHGRAMGFNYNGKLRCGELLLRESGEVMEIRRRETVDDYFATLDFRGLASFNAKSSE